MNKFGVSATADGSGIVLLLPPMPGQVLSADDALLLAAYIAALADPGGERLEQMIAEVQG